MDQVFLHEIKFTPSNKGVIREVTVIIESTQEDRQKVIFDAEDLMESFFDQDMSVSGKRFVGYKETK
jgi:hypothetical protein